MVRALRLISTVLVLTGHGTQSRGDEVAFARSLLTELQARSFTENIEYCGYIGLNDAGELAASEPVAGGPDWCEVEIPDDLEVVASYHTHAGYDEDSWSEIPSGDDMESDEEEGIDGYVSTPGGRLWFIDTTDMVASQVCGIGCLPKDPNFRDTPEEGIRQSYGYEELSKKLSE